MERPDDLAVRARRQIELGHLSLAKGTLDQAAAAIQDHVAVDGARAALDLAEQAHGLPPLETLLGRLEADEDDHTARIDLATALFGKRQLEEAIDLLVSGVRKDRQWRNQAARKQLLKIFTALGPDHPATLEGRRKLAAVLFA